MRAISLLGLLLLAAPLFAAPPVTFTDYEVHNLNDSGTDSLRQVMTDALSAGGSPRIRFSSSISFPGVIALQSPLPVITKGMVIEGPGMSQLEITRHATASAFRIFEASSGLTLTDMTLSNGEAESGGAILSQASLTLTNVRITDCVAQGANNAGPGSGSPGRGGAVAHVPTANSQFVMTGCVIEDCDALGGYGSSGGGTGDGGGLYFDHAGSVTIEDTVIDNCRAYGGSGGTLPGASGRGGGLANVADSSVGAFLMTNVTIQNCIAEGTSGGGWNGASGLGGGMYFNTDSGYVSIGARVSSCSAIGGDTGTTSTPPGGGFGGGIFLAGTNSYTIGGPEIESNSATGGFDTVSYAASRGGGVYASTTGVVAILFTRVTGNTATSGAGVAVVSGTLSCASSCIDANTGGALELETPSGPHSVQNCTISGNTPGTATGPNAGGINNLGTDLTVSYSTITANSGTGIVHSSGQQTTLTATIVAANTGSGPDLSGSIFQDGGHNLIGEYGGSVYLDGVNGNIVGSVGTPVDALLGTLDDNGGRTPTHALSASSPAVNTANPANAPTNDQRSAPRVDGMPDIGAFEFGAVPPTGSGGKDGGDGDDGACSTATGRFNWLLLLGLIALLGAGLRARRA